MKTARGYIHWPATARKGKLMLKQFDGGMEDVLWILLDMQAGTTVGNELENTEEFAVTAAASIAKSYSEVGWAVGLLAQSDRQFLLPPQEGAPAYERYKHGSDGDARKRRVPHQRDAGLLADPRSVTRGVAGGGFPRRWSRAGAWRWSQLCGRASRRRL